MVASPVADLLVPKFHDNYLEYKNDAGDILKFKTFAKDGVKMVSLNGIEMEMDELFDILQDADYSLDKENYSVIVPCLVAMTVSVVVIMLYLTVLIHV